jgi:glycine cleavage system H protein
MSTYPEHFVYTKEHEWVNAAGDTATVGITNHAQHELGDIVYVDLPKIGAHIEQGKTLGSVESVKAVSDIYAPISGEVTEINETLTAAPEKLGPVYTAITARCSATPSSPAVSSSPLTRLTKPKSRKALSPRSSNSRP